MQKLVIGNFYKTDTNSSNSMPLWYCSPIGKMQVVCATRIRGTYTGTAFYSPAVLKSMGVMEFYPIPEDEYKQGYLIYKSMNYYSLCPILYDWKQVAKSSRSRIVKQEDNLAEVVASLFTTGARQVDIHSMSTLIRKNDKVGYFFRMYYGNYDLRLGNEFWY